MQVFVRLGIVSLCVATTSCFAQTDDEVSCEAKYQDVAPVAMKMPYREFDQSPDGFRKLGNCWAQTARLLQRYADKQAYEARGVRWHMAQVLAMNGDATAAAESALLSLNPVELEQKSNFSWNAYVLATVAFLRNDRAAFDVQYEAQRAAAERYPENQTNMNVLKSLATCFGRPYKDSYPVCQKTP